jgi:hypothetical protein
MCRVAQLIVPWNTSYTTQLTGSFIPLKKEEDNKENDTKQTTDSQPTVQASSPLAGPPISWTPGTTGQTSYGSSSQLNLTNMGRPPDTAKMPSRRMYNFRVPDQRWNAQSG